MIPTCARLCAALILAFACLARNAHARPPVRHADALVAPWLRRADDYRAAERAFRAADRAGARRHLQRLARRPGLSPADRRFLRRQVALCRARA